MSAPTSPKVTSPAKSPSPRAMSPAAAPVSPSAGAAEAGAAGTVASPPGSPPPGTGAATEAALAAPAAPVASPTATDAAANTPAAPTPTAPKTPHANPQIAELQAMFPTVDVAVIEMVLESANGSQDQAIESLLQMTDPEFKPDLSVQEANQAVNQVDLDAEFARALHIQDQEDAARAERRRTSRSAQQSSATAMPALPSVLPYQPRIRRARPQQPDPYHTADHQRTQNLQDRYDPPHQPGQDSGAPPGMINFEEKVANIAEAGKQTFNSFFNRAKAKYDEYQSQQAARRAEEQEEYGASSSAAAPARSGGLWGEPRSATQRPTSVSTGSTGSIEVQHAPRRWNPSDEYDDPQPVRTSMSSMRRGSGASGGAASPDKGAAGKIDLAKLGFLPKKKVDLMSTQEREPISVSTSTATPSRSAVDRIPKTPTETEMSPHQLGDSDDDDDLEYTKNPFDEK